MNLHRNLELSSSERTAVILMAQGCTRDRAAELLDISVSTFAKALARVYAKTNTNGTTQAVAVLVARGDLRPCEFLETVDVEPMDGVAEASHLIYIRMMTELNPDKLAGLSDAYRALMAAGL